MEIKIVSTIENASTSENVFPLYLFDFQGRSAFDGGNPSDPLLRWVSEFRDFRQIDPEKSAVHVLHHPDRGPVALAFLGKIEEPWQLIAAGGKAGKALADSPAENFRVLPSPELSEGDFAFFLEGASSSDYRFDLYKTQEEGKTGTSKKKSGRLFVEARTETLGQLLFKVQAKTKALNFARDCCNRPGNGFTPKDVKKHVLRIGEDYGLKTEVIDEKRAEELGMGCFCSVAKGSEEEAFVMLAEYEAPNPDAGKLMLVGKGLTFDSGGISIKPAASMEEMKFDMCGGGAVLGAMMALAELKPDVNVVFVIPSSENLLNGKASKPGDIYRSYAGLNVEVINTDAEGRLILADALAYGVERYRPDAVIDLATLTGACLVALGKHNAGLFSNDEALAKKIEESSLKTGDRVWRLPLGELYDKQIESDFADVKNTGGKYGGAITAAAFLQKFVKDVPWAHLDIAGTAWNVKGSGLYPEKGATGFGVRLLVDFVENWSKPATPA